MHTGDPITWIDMIVENLYQCTIRVNINSTMYFKTCLLNLYSL